jgi:hypothetical protein
MRAGTFFTYCSACSRVSPRSCRRQSTASMAVGARPSAAAERGGSAVQMTASRSCDSRHRSMMSAQNAAAGCCPRDTHPTPSLRPRGIASRMRSCSSATPRSVSSRQVQGTAIELAPGHRTMASSPWSLSRELDRNGGPVRSPRIADLQWLRLPQQRTPSQQCNVHDVFRPERRIAIGMPEPGRTGRAAETTAKSACSREPVVTVTTWAAATKRPAARSGSNESPTTSGNAECR